MNIRRILTSGKTRSVLTYWYRGVRYRPVLGYNLSTDQEREAALQVITAIHTNTAQVERLPAQTTHFADQSDTTFSAFIPIYLQYLKAKRPTSDGRNELILTKHIIPYFGEKRLGEIRLEDGLAYLEKRRSDLTGPRDNRRPVAAGTIERECAEIGRAHV